MPTLSRRHLVTTAAALPALAVPVATAPLAHEPDPIFAAIEMHRRACAETSAAWGRVTDFEHVSLRSITELADDQEWCARHNEAADATDRQDDVALNLLHIQPTTVAGAAALLGYYVEAVSTDEQFFPENIDDDGHAVDAADISIDDSPPAFGYLLARNVARALAQMAVQS
jgi:hypothetical protein